MNRQSRSEALISDHVAYSMGAALIPIPLIDIGAVAAVQLDLIKGGRQIREPEYATDEYHAVTAFGTSIDEAARKATGYMVDYIVQEHRLAPDEAYALLSLVGDLHIAEVVDVPHMLVVMHVPKAIFQGRETSQAR